MSTNNNLLFKSSKLKRKKFGGIEQEGEEIKRMKKEKSGHKPSETLTCVTLIFGEKGLLDVPRFTCRSIRLGVVAIEESAKSILISLSLLQGRWSQYYLNTHRWYITYLEHCLQISPRTPFPRKPFLLPLIVFWCRQRQFIFTMKKLLNHRFPEAHYNVFHGCIKLVVKRSQSLSTV